MKCKHCLILIALVILLSSCHDEMANTDDSKHTLWDTYLDTHFTGDSFTWTALKYGDSDWNYHDQPLYDGEFVEFRDFGDSVVTLRFGDEEATFFNLADVTDNIVNHIVIRPYSAAKALQYIDIPLKIEYSDDNTACKFHGKYNDPFGYSYQIDGNLDKNLYIYKSVAFSSPFPDLRKSICDDVSFSLLKQFQASSFDFDCSSMKCSQSPLIIKWNSTAWVGDVSTLIPNISDFLQLLITIPLFKYTDYWSRESEDSDDPEFISIIDIIRKIAPGIHQIEQRQYDENTGMPTWQYKRLNVNYGLILYLAATVTKIDDQEMCVYLDAENLMNKLSHVDAKIFAANILRSLLSEDRCHFEMQYELIDCDINDKSKEREFHMTLTDPQHSRNIMEYVILPLLIENREAIKDYIRQDAELSQHADVLCAAVDRLEEIYAGTTDLTLGYRLIENQWH